MFIGLPSALKGAGLSGIQLFGVYPEAATLPYVAAGEILGSVQVSFPEASWLAADTFARLFTGESTEASENAGFPTKILTAENLESTTELLPVIPDYQEQFKALWGK
jgi:ribose transport system substrate-binding protein